jgi:mono/diheme cytochrome c family protein
MAEYDSTVFRVLLVVAVIAGCHDPTDGSVDGATIFAATCATCHGERGKPSEAMVARLAVRDLTSAEFRQRATPALVEAQVRAGSKNKVMPAFAGALTDAQIRAVAAYVANPAFVQR